MNIFLKHKCDHLDINRYYFHFVCICKDKNKLAGKEFIGVR